MDESFSSISDMTSSWFNMASSSNSNTDLAFPFTPDVIDGIQLRRQALGGTLFFDEMLVLAGLDERQLSLFPPRSPYDLSVLIQEIEQSNVWGDDDVRKNCLVYYLLKFWRDSREVQFANAKLISKAFSTIADAYFYLDTEDIPRAVRCLTDMRVVPDFIPKIMRTLSLPTPSSPSPAPLVVRFVRLAKPVLVEDESFALYLRALCVENIIDAWMFTRTFPEEHSEDARRTTFIGIILDYCLIPKPRAAPLHTLRSFPFTAYEQTVLNTYALRPPPSLPEASLAILQDLISVRLIHQGKYSEAILIDKHFVSQAAAAGRMGGSGGPVSKAAEARREIFNELVAVLPDVQRRLLHLTLDDPNPPPPPTRSAQRQNDVSNTSMSMSWEDVQPTPTDLSAPTPRPNVPPSTPLSASIAFRTANPKVAVLRAFAHANASSSRLEGSPSPFASTSRAGAPVPRESLVASQYGQIPGMPYSISSPFASRPRLAASPIQILPPPRTRSILRERISASPAPITFQSNRGPSGASAASFRNQSVRASPFAASTSSNFAQQSQSQASPSLFRAPANVSRAPLLFSSSAMYQSQQSSEEVPPERAFQPSKNLFRTPHANVNGHSNGNGGSFSFREPANYALGQSIVTPSKRTREHTESLWREAETSNEDVQMYGGDNGDDDDVEDEAMQDDASVFRYLSQEPAADYDDEERSDEDGFDEETQLQNELARVDSREDELPGAFPHEPEPRVEPALSNNHTRNGTGSGAVRTSLGRAMPTWISAAPTPIAKPTKPPRAKPVQSSASSSSATTVKPTNSSSRVPRTSGAVAASSTTATEAPTKPTRASRGRASSAQPESRGTHDADTNNARGPVRRSTRLSAAPPSPEPKAKKLRSSSSPPPSKPTSKSSSSTAARKKSSRGSAPPPMMRKTRRQTSVLENVDE